MSLISWVAKTILSHIDLHAIARTAAEAAVTEATKAIEDRVSKIEANNESLDRSATHTLIGIREYAAVPRDNASKVETPISLKANASAAVSATTLHGL